MIKLKEKDEIPEGCFNCTYSDATANKNVCFCILVKRKHKWEYSCKRWEEME